MKTVLLDTNFLVDCAKAHIDIQEELKRILHTSFEIAVLDRTLEELDTVVAKNGKEGAAAKLARTILLTKKVNVLMTSGGHVDKLLLDRANETHVIATNDAELKRKLKKKGCDVIIVRAKKKLAVIGA